MDSNHTKNILQHQDTLKILIFHMRALIIKIFTKVSYMSKRNTALRLILCLSFILWGIYSLSSCNITNEPDKNVDDSNVKDFPNDLRELLPNDVAGTEYVFAVTTVVTDTNSEKFRHGPEYFSLFIEKQKKSRENGSVIMSHYSSIKGNNRSIIAYDSILLLASSTGDTIYSTTLKKPIIKGAQLNAKTSIVEVNKKVQLPIGDVKTICVQEVKDNFPDYYHDELSYYAKGYFPLVLQVDSVAKKTKSGKLHSVVNKCELQSVKRP